MCLYLDLNTEIPHVSYFLSSLHITTPTGCSTECPHIPQLQLYVLYSHGSMYVTPIQEQSNASPRVLQLTSWCASSTDESCISSSNRTALLDEWVSLQSGVVTESRVTAETSTLSRGTNGGTCFGAPEGKKQLYSVYSPLRMQQDYQDRSKQKWKHQLLVYADV